MVLCKKVTEEAQRSDESCTLSIDLGGRYDVSGYDGEGGSRESIIFASFEPSLRILQRAKAKWTK